jgi:hypothetical protein
LREIFKFISTEVAKKYPGREIIAVGSFLFLRFLSPAITSPEGFGLIKGKKERKKERKKEIKRENALNSFFLS